MSGLDESGLSSIEKGHLDYLTDKLLKLKKHKYCNYIEAWQKIFENIIDPYDFSKVDFVEGVIKVLEQMNPMGEEVWRYIESQIFYFKKDDESWKELGEQFSKVKGNLNMGEVGAGRRSWFEKERIRRGVVVHIYGKGDKVYIEYMRKRAIVGTVVGVIIYIALEVLSNLDKWIRLFELIRK